MKSIFLKIYFKKQENLISEYKKSYYYFSTNLLYVNKKIHNNPIKFFVYNFFQKGQYPTQIYNSQTVTHKRKGENLISILEFKDLKPQEK